VEGFVALLAEVQDVVLCGGGGCCCCCCCCGRRCRCRVVAAALEAHGVPDLALELGLVSVYLGNVGREVVLGGARLEAEATGDVLVAFMYAIYVLPEVRGASVALVAQVAGEEAVGHASVVAQIFQAGELEVATHLAAKVDKSRFHGLW
jgi:hypothetical protein